MSRYIHHVTLTTGDTRRSYRSEVADVAIAALHDMLARALETDDRVSIPGREHYGLFARAEGRCMMGQVWSPEPRSMALVVLGVAGISRCGIRLWRLLHETTLPLATSPEKQPQAPWVAARLEYGAPHDLPAMEWLGDFERCLAWAWLQRVEGRHVA
jgi:hypothetical protein